MIGVLDKHGDVADVGGDGGVVVDHGDGRLLGAHLQESLNTKSNVSGEQAPATPPATPPTTGPTWFFPFKVRMLVTLPKGRPRAMISVSVASLGSFLMWSTREGGASSTLSFLLSLPLEAPSETPPSIALTSPLTLGRSQTHVAPALSKHGGGTHMPLGSRPIS